MRSLVSVMVALGGVVLAVACDTACESEGKPRYNCTCTMTCAGSASTYSGGICNDDATTTTSSIMGACTREAMNKPGCTNPGCSGCTCMASGSNCTDVSGSELCQ